MSELTDSGADMDEYGIWESLVSFCPPPAVQDMRQSLGSTFLSRNEMLWEEAKALHHVLSLCQEEIQLLSPNASSSSASRRRPLSSISRKSSTPSHSISNKSEAVNVMTTSDLIQAVCNYDVIDDLTVIIYAIKNAIIHENHELEAKISVLNDMINGEAESLSTRPTPRDLTSSRDYTLQSKLQVDKLSNSRRNSGNRTSIRVCSFCGRESSFDELVDGKTVRVSYTCALCKDVERNERKNQKTLSKPSSSTLASIISSSSESVTTSSSLSSSDSEQVENYEDSQAKIGRFRSKLQSARDEIYFFED